MALNGEEGRRRVNNERVERCAAASETSLEMYVRVGVTEWKIETRRRAHEVGGRGSEHEEGPRHRFRVLLLQNFRRVFNEKTTHQKPPYTQQLKLEC